MSISQRAPRRGIKITCNHTTVVYAAKIIHYLYNVNRYVKILLYYIVFIDINQGKGLKKAIRIVYIKNMHNMTHKQAKTRQAADRRRSNTLKKLSERRIKDKKPRRREEKRTEGRQKAKTREDRRKTEEDRENGREDKQKTNRRQRTDRQKEREEKKTDRRQKTDRQKGIGRTSHRHD